MKYTIIIFSLLLLLCCCRDTDAEDFKRNCPYKLDYPGHFLRIPVTVEPHKMIYTVGDTIQFNTIFSDSIYDLGPLRTFKIEHFPFTPVSLLYRFTAPDSCDSGYRVNELLIDSSYQHEYRYSSKYSDGYRAHTIYDAERDLYSFESSLVLKVPGRYIFLMHDLYETYDALGESSYNAAADAIQWEGKCVDDDGNPLLPFKVCNMIDSGDDHLEQFESELQYLDKEIYRGRLRFQYPDAKDVLKGGAISVEFASFFCFEVVE